MLLCVTRHTFSYKGKNRFVLFQMAELIPEAGRCLECGFCSKIFLKIEQLNNKADGLKGEVSVKETEAAKDVWRVVCENNHRVKMGN